MDEPAPVDRRSLRDRIRKDPEARRRFGRAYAELLAAVLFCIVVLGLLFVWVVRRRAERVRASLSPPRPVRWPESPPTEPPAVDAPSD